LILGVVDRLLNFLAKGRFGFVAEDQVAHSTPQPRAAFVLPRSHQAASS
jgi:hypothetical protein